MGAFSRKGIIRLGAGIIVLLLLPALAAGAQADGPSYHPHVSADGRIVTFDSQATNLVTGDGNGVVDVFVRNRSNGKNTLVSKSTAGAVGNDQSNDPEISANGRYVAFRSAATSLVAGDTNSMNDIFVRDRRTGVTTLISKSSAGTLGDSHSYHPALSSDGRYVTFYSQAANLVTGDANGKLDVFVRDRQTGTTTLVSKSSAGVKGNDHSSESSISGDGRFVAFVSNASNLVPGDTNHSKDIFVRNRTAGTTSRVSLGLSNAEANGPSFNPVISADGRYVAFESSATNMVAGDTNNRMDVFVRDRQTGKTTLISRSTGGTIGNALSDAPCISPDGRYVAFESYASNFAAGDSNSKIDIYLRDRQNGTTTLISKTPGGVAGGGYSEKPALSADGRYMFFESDAPDLVVGDTNAKNDIFVRDRQTGTTILLSKS